MSIQRVIAEKVGRCTYCATQPSIWNPKMVTIGSFVSIGRNVRIGNGKHPLDYLSTSPYFYLDRLGFKNSDMISHPEYTVVEPVIIGNDVWIGDNVTIFNGVTVHDGAVLGASTVVTKDVPPYAIVVGNPAKILRYRFDEETIAQLLKLKWWEKDDDIIRNIPYDDINAAINFLKNV